MFVSKKRRPHVATPDEIRIERDGDFAIISYLDASIETTQYQVGAERLSRMSDDDILALWNAGLATSPEDSQRSRRDMRGLVGKDRVLECVVSGSPTSPNDPFLRVGDRTYTAMELAALLGSKVGARIVIEIEPTGS